MTAPVRLFEKKADQIVIPQQEILRYMGYRTQDPDARIMSYIDEVTEEFNQTVQYRACYATAAIERDSCGALVFPFGTVQAQALRRNLEGCREAYVFCATAGIGADRLITRLSVTDPAKSVIADAVATAAVEAFCDVLCGELPDPQFQRPRFSPGYGDLSLDYQAKVLQFLDASRKINVQLTQSMMMVPTKSVTAIVGIGSEACSMQEGCVACGQKNCAFRRRNNEHSR